MRAAKALWRACALPGATGAEGSGAYAAALVGADTAPLGPEALVEVLGLGGAGEARDVFVEGVGIDVAEA